MGWSLLGLGCFTSNYKREGLIIFFKGDRAPELCGSRGGRPGLSSLINYGFFGRKGTLQHHPSSGTLVFASCSGLIRSHSSVNRVSAGGRCLGQSKLSLSASSIKSVDETDKSNFLPQWNVRLATELTGLPVKTQQNNQAKPLTAVSTVENRLVTLFSEVM